jgi:hypothetical protein
LRSRSTREPTGEVRQRDMRTWFALTTAARRNATLPHHCIGAAAAVAVLTRTVSFAVQVQWWTTRPCTCFARPARSTRTLLPARRSSGRGWHTPP